MKHVKFHVTDLDSILWFNRLEDMTTKELIDRLMRKSSPNESMLAGTAWHSILENPPEEIGEIEKDGFDFKVTCDCEIIMPQIREIRASKKYEVDGFSVTLTGGCDGITGNEVSDHKLSFNPNPDTYFTSYQWKAYLDIYQADIFNYIIYHAKEKDGAIEICDVSKLTMYSYPGMETDLVDGIRNLLNFAKDHMPFIFKS